MPVLTAPVFCCSLSHIRLRMAVRTPCQTQIFRFVWALTGPDSSLPTPTVPPQTSLIPSHLVAPILYVTRFAIQVEKWEEGHKVEERFFIRHPSKVHAWIELEKYHIWQDFVRNWEHIKLGCDHRHTHYVLKMLERYDESMETFQGEKIDSDVMDSGKVEEDLGDEEIDWEEVVRSNRIRRQEKASCGKGNHNIQESFEDICPEAKNGTKLMGELLIAEHTDLNFALK